MIDLPEKNYFDNADRNNNEITKKYNHYRMGRIGVVEIRSFGDENGSSYASYGFHPYFFHTVVADNSATAYLLAASEAVAKFPKYCK